MLNERDVAHTYREYTKDPLSVDELRNVLGALGVRPREVLRKRDAKTLGVGDDVDDDALIALMSEHPGLLQRPIGLTDDGRAAVGRPVENLLQLID